ncbi:MAG TPA: MauE/DoxX family redox-associated membrane protein [Thermodesulfobacteriota bacterium]|nr:DoxX family membrane protein [Deltaproteobacteria bacterium]HNR12503.1 MauE/DoxX family redox-associated membrane protein [Thermodesulfobacteriota bacterium]HNU70497.1 MauE/DoxX family redox-associated membrane protein [Thermodesulfobacteriota bacterium]HQO76958.1 MauE/DoxX family redox-associated membrane protein [Thermodesulfobacteriota bacterium]
MEHGAVEQWSKEQSIENQDRRRDAFLSTVSTFAKKIFTHPITAVVGRLVLGSIFVYAGWDKINDPEAFAEAIHNYRILPVASINLVAIVLPWIELVCGALLVAGVFTGGSSLLIAALLGSFLLALISALVRGLDISCGCFSGRSKDPITIWYLLRDGTLLLFSLQILFFDQCRYSLARLRKKRSAV